MPIHLYLDRFSRYYKKNGLINTVRRFFMFAWQGIVPQKTILFYADLTELSDINCNSIENLSIESKSNLEEIHEHDMDSLIDMRGEEFIKYQLKERFGKGAILWLVKLEGKVAGIIWSIKKIPIKPHFFPLSDNDVHLFDNEIFPQFRGRGINPMFINFVLSELKKIDSNRVFIETPVENASEIRSLSKTCFSKFGIARKLHIWGRNITIWNEMFGHN